MTLSVTQLEYISSNLTRLIGKLNVRSNLYGDTSAASEIVLLLAAQAAAAGGMDLGVALMAQGYSYSFVYLLSYAGQF